MFLSSLLLCITCLIYESSATGEKEEEEVARKQRRRGNEGREKMSRENKEKRRKNKTRTRRKKRKGKLTHITRHCVRVAHGGGGGAHSRIRRIIH